MISKTLIRKRHPSCMGGSDHEIPRHVVVASDRPHMNQHFLLFDEEPGRMDCSPKTKQRLLTS
jgi:hypothetical protein